MADTITFTLVKSGIGSTKKIRATLTGLGLTRMQKTVTRKDTPELMNEINHFLRKYGKGTLVGNDTFNRYLTDANRVRCAHSGQSTERTEELAGLFQLYGDRYDFDWLMLAAQGYQESGLRQDRRSPAGAVGIMQVMPTRSTFSSQGISSTCSSTPVRRVSTSAAARRWPAPAPRYFPDSWAPPRLPQVVTVRSM